GVEGCGHRPSLPAAMISSEAGRWLAQFRADALPDLLQGPVITVRVGEEDELAAVAGVQDLDRRDLDATPGQLGAGRVDVGDHQLEAGSGPAARVRFFF